MPLNESDFSLDQTQKLTNQSNFKSEKSVVNYDDDILPYENENQSQHNQTFDVLNTIKFQRKEKLPCKNAKEQFMRSHQENAFKNILQASSKLQNLKEIQMGDEKSEKTIKIKQKKSRFMEKLWSKNQSNTASRLFEGGGDSHQKIKSSGDSKINQTNTFTTNQLISNQLPCDDYQSSLKAFQQKQEKVESNKQSSNFPLNSQEFDKIILDQDPNTLNPYINGSSLKKQFQQETLQKRMDQSEMLNNSKIETKSVKITDKKKLKKNPKCYKRHQSILLPESTAVIDQQMNENQAMNSQDGILKTEQDEKKLPETNSYHNSRHQSCSQSLSSNVLFRTQQKFLSKRSECDSLSLNQKFGQTMNKGKGKLGLSHKYQQSFNYEQFNQHLEKMYAEQFVVQDSDMASMSSKPLGIQRKSIIGTRRKLAKTKKKYGLNATNRPQTEFNIYQSIMHDNGPDQQKSRRIGRYLRYLTQDEDEQISQPLHRQKMITKPEQKLHNLITSATVVRKSGRQQVPKILKEQSNKHIRNKTILGSFMFKTKVKQFKEDIKDTFSPLKKKKQLKSQNQENDQIDSDDYLKAFDDMEVDPELLRERKKDEEGMFLIQPDSIYRAAWDISLFLSIIYQSISLPARISFEVKFSEFLFILEIIIDVMFLIDIFLNFNTGIYIKTRLIMNRQKIAIDYFAWWFWIDLVSSCPLTWILAWSQGMTLRQIESDDQMSQLTDSNINQSVMADAPGLLKLLKVSKLLKMLKLLRVAKLKKLMIKFEEYIVTDSMDLMVTFFNITVQIMFIAHYMGCFFYYKGMDSMRVNNEGWLLSEEMLDIDPIDSYITSIYWAFTTMSAVGYGDITPVTKDEQRYTMIAMVLSCGIFAYTINSISNIVSRFNKNSSVYREKMMYVNQFLKSKDLPQETRMKVRRYLDYVFQQKKEIKIEEADVYKILNESLRDQVQLIIKGRIVNKLLFLENFGLDFLSELTMKLESTSFIQDDFIFMEKDKADCMYFIIQGKVAMIHKQSSTFVTDLGNHDYFGEYGLLKDETRCLSAKCRDFTEAYVISKKDFEEISENCIEAVRSIRLIKNYLENDNLKHLKVKCYICKRTDHLALRCPQFPKWRGNLMRMLLQQNKDTEARPLDDENKDTQQKKVGDDEGHKKQIFIYAEEAQEQKIQVSDESEETLKIKTNLIRYNVKEKVEMLDGELISTFFEYPALAYNQGYCDFSPNKMNSIMSSSSVVRGRQSRMMGNDPSSYFDMLMVNQDGSQSYDQEQLYSPEFPRLINKSYLEDSVSLQQNISPNKTQLSKQQFINSTFNINFKLPKIPEAQEELDNLDNSQVDSKSVKDEQILKQIKEATSQRHREHSSSSAVDYSQRDNSSESGLTSSLNSSQNSNSKRISNRNGGNRDQMTPDLKKQTGLQFNKSKGIIDLPPSPKNALEPSNTLIDGVGKKTNVINQDISTEMKGKKSNQHELKTLQNNQKKNFFSLQKELTFNSRNSKNKTCQMSSTVKRGGTDGKKRMARSNSKRRRGSTASRLEQSFDAYNHLLTQTGLQLKKLNTNTSKSKSQWVKIKSESQQNDVQRSKIKSGDDNKQKDQQHIFTNSVSLSKKITVIEEEKNNIGEQYLEDTPNHQKHRSQQEAMMHNNSFINDVINSPLADIRSSNQGFYLRDSSLGQGGQSPEKKNIMKNRPIIDSQLFQIKNKMGHTHKLSSQMVNEINGLISPKSNITISSKQI